MINLTAFNTFQPTMLLSPSAIPQALLKRSFSLDLIVIGELHGVAENASALYTLFHVLNASALVIERSEAEVGAFISSLADEPDFSLIDDAVFTSSVLSLEMAKTIAVLLKEGVLKSLHYIDSPSDEDVTIEKDLALGLEAVGEGVTTVAVMGNWHTTLESTATHVSALSLFRKDHYVVYIEYRYGPGTYFNAGTGLDSTDGVDSGGEYCLRAQTDDTYTFLIPEAHPITHK